MDLKEYEQLLNDVENRLDRLKALYEQWFQGVERLEPAVPRKELERRMQALFKEKPRNTALRFRYQMLIQRWTTYLTYWQRVTRQIEEGTYRRDLLKARNRREVLRTRGKAELGLDVDIDVEDEIEAGEIAAAAEARAASRRVGAPPALAPLAPIAPIAAATPGTSGQSAAPAARRPLSTFGLPGGMAGAPKTPYPSAPPKPIPPPGMTASGPAPAARTPAPAIAAPAPATATFGRPRADASRPSPAPVPSSPPSPAMRPQAPQAMGDQDLRRIHQQFVDARRRNNEPADVKYETLAKSIRDMEPRLREKYAGKKIDFEVVVQNGKVGLKPVPR